MPKRKRPTSTYEMAVAELASSAPPHPDDFLAGYTPTTALWYLRECARIVSMRWTADMMVDGTAELDSDGLLQRVMLGIVQSTRILNACCVEMELIEPEEGDEEPEALWQKGEEVAIET